MSESKRGLTKAEVHVLFDEKMKAVAFEVGQQIGTTWHDLMTYPLRTVEDCEFLTAAIQMQRAEAASAGKPFAVAVLDGLLNAIEHVRGFLASRH